MEVPDIVSCNQFRQQKTRTERTGGGEGRDSIKYEKFLMKFGAGPLNSNFVIFMLLLNR